jgi:hypothetical protein
LVTSLVVTIGTVITMAGVAEAPHGWLVPTALEIFGWVGLAGVGGFASLVLSTAAPLADVERRLNTQFTLLAASTACRNIRVRGVRVAVVPSSLPLAFCAPGADGGILVSSRLERDLSPEQFRAILEHERAHMRHRHGRIIQLAQLNHLCLPMIPGARHLEEATRLLIELIADDASARHVGAVNTANALLKVGTLRGDDSMLLRARRVAARPPRGSLGVTRSARQSAAPVG